LTFSFRIVISYSADSYHKCSKIHLAL